LSKVIPHLPDNYRQQVVSDVLNVIRKTQNQLSFPHLAISDIVPYIPENLKPQIIEIIHAFDAPYKRSMSIEHIVQYLPPDLKYQSSIIVHEDQNKVIRAKILGELATGLPYNLRNKVLNEALSTARDIPEHNVRASVLF